MEELSSLTAQMERLAADLKSLDEEQRVGLRIDVNAALNRIATGGLEPDLTLVLDLPPELGFARIRKSGQRFDRIEQAGPEFHARVAEVFRNATGPRLVHLDATVPSEQVLRMAWGAIEARRPGARPARRD